MRDRRCLSRSSRARSHACVFALFAALLAAGVGSCRGGCDGAGRQRHPLGGRLSLFPAATTVVMSLDVARLRGTPLLAKVAGLAAQTQADEKELALFTQRTGLDPLRHIDSVVVAFPEEARRHGEFGLVLRASVLDQARLIAYVREQLQAEGDDLVSVAHGHRTLWSRRSQPQVAGFFIDDRTFVLGAGGWAKWMADLSEGGSAAGSAETNQELVSLCERAAGKHAVWGAAIVPKETRRLLSAEPRFKSAASVTRLAGGLELTKGLEATVLADVATAGDAIILAEQVTESLRGAKRNPEILMLGLGPYLDAVSARGVGSTFEVRIGLSEAQVGDLVDRAAAFVKLSRQGAPPGFPGAAKAPARR